jgi:sensor c-di-GMP phosphodiesterase-like protein
MRTLRQRVLVTLAATVVAAAVGALAGFLLGRALTLHHEVAKLDQYATRIRREAETSASEARGMLAAIDASPYPFCSDQEIGWIHKRVFQSEYLKDGGRIRDGAIACSAVLDRLNPPFALPRPDFTRKDGTQVYLNLVPLRIGDKTVVTIGMGDAFIVYSPWNLKDLGSASMHFTVTAIDSPTGQAGRLVGEQSQAQGSILTNEGEARAGDILYLTRCSSRYLACMTAYISIPEALKANRGEFTAYIAISGLSGALVGFAFSLVYRRRSSIEQQLRRAIQRDALKAVYQPIVELTTGRIVGAEALVRWTDEDNVAVSPDVFIRIAEECGFVGEITRLMVGRALREFRSTLLSRPGFRVNVNIAAADLGDPAFLPMLEKALEREGVPAHSLGIEITESFTARQQVATSAILLLRRKGHIVHIDDFGTGYSSLAYLHDLSVDAIKIERAFTKAIGTQSVTVSILPQILSMAAMLNLQVIVEGIETSEQASYFASSELPLLAQGWLFGHPVPADLFHLVLAENEKETAGSLDQTSA